MKKTILTGDRPTGPLHLGHYVGSLKNRVELQLACRQFIIIADMQALTDHAEQPDIVRKNVLEVTLDYLAAGIDPKLSTIFIQSMIPELSELTMYFLNLVTVARLERNPTVKTEIQQKEFSGEIPAGFLTYPVSQAADITAFKANLVPVGEDQKPMIEQTNEIVRKFNRVYKCDVLLPVEALIPEIARLPGTDGKAKMSKSLGNAVYLSDSTDIIAKKVKMMFTDPNHLKVEDPGTIEGNVVFSYLDAFDSDKAGIEELKAHYRRGGLGDGVVKQRLKSVLEELLEPMRKKRKEFASDPGEVWNIIKKGTEDARTVAAKTLSEVRKVMHIDYLREI